MWRNLVGPDTTDDNIILDNKGYKEVDIVRTVYHLVIYMQSNKIHKLF